MTGVDLGAFSILDEGTEGQDCCIGMRGDVNGDGNDADISDLVYLVDFMFGGGPEPPCFEEADVNGDTMGPDISDLVYLVDYMFGGGPPPLDCGQIADGFAKAAVVDPTCILELTQVDGHTTVSLSSEFDLRGLQIELTGRGAMNIEQLSDNNVDLVYVIDDDAVRLGLLDLDGTSVIPAGSRRIIRLDGDYELSSALAVDDNLRCVVPSCRSKAQPSNLPERFVLHANYPNPFNPVTNIRFDLPEPSSVQLVVYNLLGQEVTTLVDEHRDAGSHTVSWDASNQASGVYFYRLTASSFVDSKKMVLLK
jgi:hypothetical protein